MRCLVSNSLTWSFLPADRKVVGFAMYYFTYDPWVGKQLYLEEFYVMDEYRGKNISICLHSLLLCSFIDAWIVPLSAGLGIGSGILRNLSNVSVYKLKCILTLAILLSAPT